MYFFASFQIQQFGRSFLRSDDRVLQISIGSMTELNPAKTVTQIVEVIDRRAARREKRLIELLQTYHNADKSNLILIFVLYKTEAAQVCEYLQRKGNYKCSYIQGDKSQSFRTATLEKFRTGEVPILVATDVAARGLDVNNITHVINFSMGLSVEQYTHRIGRCGRAGKLGVAHTFFVDYDGKHTQHNTSFTTFSLCCFFFIFLSIHFLVLRMFVVDDVVVSPSCS